IKAAQQEFDLLHSEKIQNVMPVANVHYFEGHLFTITEWPFTIKKRAGSGSKQRHIYTLQDLLQSGIGLPDEQIAISWSYRLCQALADLHKHQIIIAELDPDTIIVSDDTYNGRPALTVSWLPRIIRTLLPETSIAANMAHFSAPEALLGKPEGCSDIYSLGAILYLLLTGTAPDDAATRMRERLRSPRELNPRISSGADEVVMWALTLDRDERFQSADEMLDALLRLTASTKPTRPGTRPLISGKFTRPLVSSKFTGPLAKGPDKEKRENTARADKEKHENIAASTSEEIAEIKQDTDVTVSIVPLQRHLARRWHISRIPTRRLTPLKALAIEKIVEGAMQPTAEAAKTRSTQVMPAQDAQPPAQTEAQIEDIPPATPSVEASLTDVAQEAQSSVSSAEIPVDTLQGEASAEVPPSDIVPDTPPAGAAVELVDTVPVTSSAEEAVDTASEASSVEVEASDAAIEVPAIAYAIELVNTVPVGSPVEDSEDSVLAASAAEAPALDVRQDIQSGGSAVETPLPDARPVERLEEAAPVDSQSAQIDLQQEEEQQRLAEPELGIVKRPVMPQIPDTVGQFFKELLTGTTPALPPGLVNAGRGLRDKATKILPAAEAGETFFKRLQHFILGEQQRSTTAAALVETPLRVQPNQSYAIRIHIMGRSEAKKDAAGLSSFVQGETVHIEVRSDLYENFAYVVQQADVQIPGRGYAVEVMMPMQPFSKGPSGRRERLQLSFMDDERQPLYDKPFVVEIFISHLVQSGREGHNVLTIPV
ncbi:MAG: hypothetical protein JOZ18_09465, partial [Chloroflexi bacterium]|nr:hypothetical protein [Chloroflexota bacterium]